MQRALKKVVAVLLAAGLIAGGPAFAHAPVQSPGGAATHESHAVPHYADLAIDPGTEECAQTAPSAPHNHDGLCDTCCTVCLGATLIPAVPASVWGPAVARDAFSTRDDILTAHFVLIEPGIPKPL
jgi:hypothetical protein